MLTTTIISCQQRAAARARTLPQLEAAGLHPRVFLSACQPAGAEGNALATQAAITHAQAMGGDLLFCEDDIDLAPDFRAALALARTVRDQLVYLYLHENPARLQRLYGLPLATAVLQRRTVPTGLYPLRADAMGGQCTFVPHAVLTALPPVPRRTPCDHYFASIARDTGALVRLPHAVQHRQERGGRQPAYSPDKRSLSYDLPRGGDA